MLAVYSVRVSNVAIPVRECQDGCGRSKRPAQRPKLTPAQREHVLAWADATPRLTLAALQRRVAEEWGDAMSET